MSVDTNKLNNLITLLTAGVEKIHGDTLSGPDKKAMVMNAIAEAASVAEAVDPKDGALIEGAAKLASIAIDAIVSVFNSLKIFGKKKAAA